MTYLEDAIIFLFLWRLKKKRLQRDSNYKLHLQTRKNRHWLERYHFVVNTLTLGFEDKFRSANQMDGISIAGRGKMTDS